MLRKKGARDKKGKDRPSIRAGGGTYVICKFEPSPRQEVALNEEKEGEASFVKIIVGRKLW